MIFKISAKIQFILDARKYFFLLSDGGLQSALHRRLK